MVKILKFMSGEEVVGQITKSPEGSLITMKKPCAIMLIGSKSSPDQHSMALIPYAAYTKDHEIEIDARHVMWEAELADDVLNQYNSLFGSGIQIVSGHQNPNTSQLNIVGG
jgi:hypothetical protein